LHSVSRSDYFQVIEIFRLAVLPVSISKYVKQVGCDRNRYVINNIPVINLLSLSWNGLRPIRNLQKWQKEKAKYTHNKRQRNSLYANLEFVFREKSYSLERVFLVAECISSVFIVCWWHRGCQDKVVRTTDEAWN
jgi:hypothetical protein